ncbi:MAG: hypothetical protein IH571_06060, partial [Acholeplasmataceae bacterium]|nr:hypothetical protein [Acholeplasmataceae bacterium]
VEGRTYVESIQEAYYKPLEMLVEHLGEEDTATLLRILEKTSKYGKIEQ